MPQASPRRRSSSLPLLVRVLGVCGVFAALLGLVPLRLSMSLRSRAAWQSAFDRLLAQDFANPLESVGVGLVAVGVLLAAVSLLTLGIGALRFVAGRGNAARVNGAVQVALAVALLIGVNLYSFRHHKRYDWTASKQFTLPASISTELDGLRGETTIAVLQRHKTFGQLSDKPDATDFAAERKVVEKVQDLVRLLRAFGPRFRVVVLDVEEEQYAAKLDAATKDAPELRKAIDAASENSIFFHAKGTSAPVQRLSFNEFLQLDKTASRERGNLVLLPQGVEPFARRVLAIEERRPKVGLAVVHEWLGTEGYSDITASGMKKALAAQGFDVVDLILKKKWDAGEPEPAAYTLAESKYERLEEELAEQDAALKEYRAELKGTETFLDRLKTMSLADLNRALREQLRGREFDERSRQMNIRQFQANVEAIKEVVATGEKERETTYKQLLAMPDQERVQEERRLADLEAKFTRLAGECDLIIVPRLTVMSVVRAETISPRLHRLDDIQSNVLKRFVQSGKPILGLFGPNAESPASRRPPGPAGQDKVEALFAEFGIVLGSQTILGPSDAKAFADRRANLLATGATADAPPVRFDAPPAVARGTLAAGDAPETMPQSPIMLSMRTLARSVGAETLDVKMPYSRPVYYVSARGGNSEGGVILASEREAWNEEQPFATREKTPRYEPTKPGDPTKDTRDEKRRASFPLGVAVKTTVPAAWAKPELEAVDAASLAGLADPLLAASVVAVPADRFAPKEYHPTPVRIAALGQGGVFAGNTLSPATERLLVNTCNWLLARDERLPKGDGAAWEYPRVNMSPQRESLWQMLTLGVLPGACVFLGCVAMLIRRHR